MSRVLVLLSLMAVLQGCAHNSVSSADERLDKKLAQETAVRSRTDLSAEATQLIDTAPGLTAAQKSELSSLRKDATAQTDKIRSASLKLRALLVKDVLSSTYDSDEVESIKRRIKDLEQQRLSVFFRAVRDANTLLGRWSSKSDRITSQMLDEMTIDMFQQY